MSTGLGASELPQNIDIHSIPIAEYCNGLGKDQKGIGKNEKQNKNKPCYPFMAIPTTPLKDPVI